MALILEDTNQKKIHSLTLKGKDEGGEMEMRLTLRDKTDFSYYIDEGQARLIIEFLQEQLKVSSLASTQQNLIDSLVAVWADLQQASALEVKGEDLKKELSREIEKVLDLFSTINKNAH